MVHNQKVTGTASSVGMGLAVAGLFSMTVTVLGSLLAANLVLRGVIPEQSIGYCSMVILLAASAAGAAVAMGKIKHRLLLVSMLSGCVYYLLLLATTLFFLGGQLQGMGATALMVLCGSGTVALVGARGKGRPNSRRRKVYRR